MPKAETLTYTPNELEAIEILRNNAGVKMSAADLGIKTAILTSLVRKFNDERPMTDGSAKVEVFKEDYEAVCPTCGAKIAHKVYWVEK